MFRWGIISSAKIARDQVIPAIGASNNGIVHGIASRSIAKADVIATQSGAAKAYGSYESLLDDPDIDGVYIPLHTSGHVEWTLKAAKAGKHVLCEKPIAMHASEIDELMAARDTNNVLISEAFMVNYHPQWHKVKELIAAGTIGQLRHIEGAFSYFNTDPDNMRNSVELGGGGLRDIGVYPVVTTRIATGCEPKSLRAHVEYDDEFGTDVYSRVEVQFDGFLLSFYCSTQLALRQHMVFHGDEGFISLDAPFNAGAYDHARVRLFDQTHSDAQVFKFPSVNQYVEQVQAFANAARGEGEVFSLESSKLNEAVIDACFEAGKTNNWVALS